MEDLQLVPIQNVDAVALFVQGGIDGVLKSIEDQVAPLVFDVTTARGRKDCASTAHKVAQSKVYLDNIGKDLVSDWKEKAKKVDADRKKARDFLDDLKIRVREPLTAFEEAEEARQKAEDLRREIEAAHEDALRENETFDRMRDLERKEAELNRLKAEAEARAEAERREKERQEREARIAAEAAEKAKRQAEEAAERERAALERAKREAEEKARIELEAAARRERELKEAAERAERDRIAAEAKAKADQEAAVRAAEERAKAEAERKERERLEAEAKAKAAAERAAKNNAHRLKICKEILSDFQKFGIEAKTAEGIFDLINDGAIRHLRVEY